MSEEKNIKTFTAADIEKYWAGKLSTSEMYAMEMAALDDPFLADAMEGYKNTTDFATDLNTLRNKIDKRLVALAPVIPLKQKKLPWLKVAAAIIIIVGVGVLVQQMVFSGSKQRSVASLEKNDDKKSNEVAANNNPVVPATPGNQGDFITTSPDSPSIKTQQKASNDLNAGTNVTSANPDTTNISTVELARTFKQLDDGKKDSATRNSVAAAEAEVVMDKLENESLDRSADDSSKKRIEYNAAGAPKAKFFRERDGVSQGVESNFSNKYNYRVVDAQNKPVPFANVMNTRDNVGTYTDIRGNFNLVSNDSILNVQIKSLGYLSNNYKIVPSGEFKNLTLNEDFYARRQILDSNRQLVSNVTRKDTTELEEPEVGWGYFNTYVANNIQIPENIRKKSTLSNVELSFDVDKAGTPINIKVTKSSQCKECDEEAKRLLKEGPKWKRKGKKSNTTISIAVDQK